MGFVVLFCIAFANSPKAKQPEAPSECKEALKQAAILGKALYEKDMLAAWATDAMFREKILPNDKRIRGWVTLPVEGGREVRFLGKEKDTLLLLYTVKFRKFPSRSAMVVRHEKPEMPSGDTRSMFRARKSASASKKFKPFTNRYNTVVLPAKLIGAKGWLVYLLAASTKADEIVVGGHYRVLVSPSGKKVLKVEPLSKSFFVIKKPKETEDKKLVGPYMTHLVTNCPFEIHVFLSLLHRTPLFVGTKYGAWKVNSEEISFLAPPREKR
jgi:hypothetical protein